jgi:cell division protein FtsI/penicillin-binding protein 2
LVFQQDGVRRYEYNPRLVSLGNELARGSIYDRNGVPLATSSCEEIDRYRARYAEIGVPPGICSAAESRHYPFGPLTFHLLGDVRTRLNWGARNTAYIERDAASRLRGYTETAVLEKSEDPAASVLVRRDYSSLVPLLRYRHQPDHPRMKRIRDQDRSVRSTIDIRFTALVSEIFKKRLRLSGSDKGAIIVIDAGTGDVLAAVSEPTPAATFESTNTDELLDRGRYGLYPPGSTFKLVTAAAALRVNPGLAETELECRRLPGGRVGASVRGGLVRDDVADREPHGKLRMERAIAVSCNAYFAQLAEERLGAAPLFEMATMLDLTVAHPNTPSQLGRFLPQAAYGQGEVLVTPFQMARVAAMVANGGSPLQGRWVLGGGQDERSTRAVLSAENAAFLAHSMRLVVTEGTGTSAFDSPVPIAGKTGTAEIAGALAHAWFVGFAPYGQRSHRTIAFAILVGKWPIRWQDSSSHRGRVGTRSTGLWIDLGPRQHAIVQSVGSEHRPAVPRLGGEDPGACRVANLFGTLRRTARRHSG